MRFQLDIAGMDSKPKITSDQQNLIAFVIYPVYVTRIRWRFGEFKLGYIT